MKRKLILVLTLISASYFSLQFFYKDQEKKTTHIRLALSNKVRSFDPAVVFNDDGLSVMAQTLDSLYQYHYLKRPYEVVPALAKSLPEISNEGKTYTIELKENVYYHPHPSLDFQRVVRAQDFVNQFKRLAFKPIESVGRWLFDDLVVDFKEFSERVQESQKKFDEDTIAGVKAIDDLTLQIHLKRSEPNFLYFLAMLFVTPIPEELIAFAKNDFTSTLIGTGPYLYKGLVNN